MVTPLEGYRDFGGRHPETAALRNILACYGVRASHTGDPFSEAMLVGIGGLGAGYILWEFVEHKAKVLVLGFHSHWQYSEKYLGGLCERLGIAVRFHHTGGQKAAAGHLSAALGAGHPVLAWVDVSGLPARYPETPLYGSQGHVVAVCGLDGETVLIDDRARRPFPVEAQAFGAARARIGSFKNRLLQVEPPEEIDLEAAIRASLAAMASHLGAKSDSFSLPAFRKWARLMTDPKNKKGWPVVFADRQGLYGALVSLYEGVLPVWASGGSLRDVYADFLVEAQSVIGDPVLAEAAERYRALADRWRALAQAALPAGVDPFQEVRDLLEERRRGFLEGPVGLDRAHRATRRLTALARENNRAFPLDEAGVQALFGELQAHLEGIYGAEVEARQALEAVL